MPCHATPSPPPTPLLRPPAYTNARTHSSTTTPASPPRPRRYTGACTPPVVRRTHPPNQRSAQTASARPWFGGWGRCRTAAVGAPLVADLGADGQQTVRIVQWEERYGCVGGEGVLWRGRGERGGRDARSLRMYLGTARRQRLKDLPERKKRRTYCSAITRLLACFHASTSILR
jgi:hypothetical protein